jgi:hypothetical protein
LFSPSYWCARRWDWIWATVSIVTETTIRIEVPPSAMAVAGAFMKVTIISGSRQTRVM